MLQTFKILNNYDITSKSDLLKRNISTRTRGNDLKLFKKYASRTETRKNSFTNRVVDTWNTLPNEIVKSPSINAFKSILNKHWRHHSHKFTAECYTNEERRTQTDGSKEAAGFHMAYIQLKDSKTPLTSTELANTAGYKERYVREWLGAMTAARVIAVQDNDCLEESCRYILSEEQYDIVESCAIFGKGVFACHNRMGILKSCFEKDGPQGDAEAFQGENWEFFEEYREKTGERELLTDILPKVESVPEFRTQLQNGCRVLDLGCGSGTFTLCMAERYPKSTFWGIDVGNDFLHRANVKSERKHISNIKFTRTTLEAVIEDKDEQFDLITAYQVLHNMPDPEKAIRDLYSLLKPSGKLILLEVGRSSSHLHNVGNMSTAENYAFSLFFCLACSMSEKPHVGYATGWGEENMLKALDKYFIVEDSFKISFSDGLYLLSKRER